MAAAQPQFHPDQARALIACGYRLALRKPLPPDTITDILEQRVAGRSFAKIADDLNARSVPPRRPGKWWPSTVKQVCDEQEVEAHVT